MKISAVIPTYNRCEALEKCIGTLLKQDLPTDQFEIVVVVDGSSDGTGEMLKSLKLGARLVVIEQQNKGKSAALNVGMKAATGEIVLIVDDDFLCDRALLYYASGSTPSGFAQACLWADPLHFADVSKLCRKDDARRTRRLLCEI